MRWNTNHRFAVLPYQTPGLLESVGLTERQCMEAAWYVDVNGQKYCGAAAINASLNALGGIYRLASWFYRIPGMTQIEDWMYAWIARNRYRMPGGDDACEVADKGQKPTT